ncbi:hypothetical protein [Halorussus amylolyticus]|nr:hypothetical protein [Halorussus amylolyticus]
MSADKEATADSASDDDEISRRDELYEAVVEFEEGDTPTEDDVRSAFLSQ